MRTRIKTNGEIFVPQYEKEYSYGRWWNRKTENKWVDEGEWGGDKETYPYALWRQKTFKTFKGAHEFLKKKYGTSMELIREWRAA